MQLCRHPSKGAISIHYIIVYRKPESKINTLGQYINYPSPAPFHSCRKQAYETLPVVSVRRHPLNRTHQGLNPRPDPGVSCGDEHIFIQPLMRDSMILWPVFNLMPTHYIPADHIHLWLLASAIGECAQLHMLIWLNLCLKQCGKGHTDFETMTHNNNKQLWSNCSFKSCFIPGNNIYIWLLSQLRNWTHYKDVLVLKL